MGRSGRAEVTRGEVELALAGLISGWGDRSIDTFGEKHDRGTWRRKMRRALEAARSVDGPLSGGSRLPWNVENAPSGWDLWCRSGSYSTRERAMAEVPVWKAIYRERGLERRWRVRNRDTDKATLV